MYMTILCVHAPSVCLILTEFRKGHWVPWSWNYIPPVSCGLPGKIGTGQLSTGVPLATSFSGMPISESTVSPATGHCLIETEDKNRSFGYI